MLYESSSADDAISFLEKKHWQVISKGNDNTVNTLKPYQKIEMTEKYSWAIIEKEELYSNDLSASQLPAYIIYISPFFLCGKEEEVGLSHLFYVRLFKSEDLTILENIAKENNVEIIGNNKFMPLWYTLACTKKSVGNAIEMANLFYESGKFNAAEPDLMVDDLPMCVDDDYFSYQ